jgi:hypothetical protein
MTKQQHYYTHNQKQAIEIFEAQWSNNTIAHTTKKNNKNLQSTMKQQHYYVHNQKQRCNT